METASTLSSSAAAVLCLVPNRVGHDLQYRELYKVTSEIEPTYDLWTIDDPHRAWANPLSLSLRVKGYNGYNGAPYCILLSSKKIFIVIQLCITFVSSGHNPLEGQATAAKLFSIYETLLFHSPGYGILPSNIVFQHSGRVSVMELHLSVDRSILPFLGNQYGLTDYFDPNLGILQTSSYPPPEYYGGGGADPPDRPGDSGKEKALSTSQDNEQDYRQGSAGGSSGGNNEDSGPSNRRGSKKTAMACHRCRERKLKCGGVRPTCRPCADKSLVCTYDDRIKRRGPGKKSLQQESSTGQPDTTTPQPSSSRTAGSISAPIASLPSPPVPQYPYQLGAPPSGLESRVASSSRLASETRHSGQITERYAEDFSSSHARTQQPRPSGSAYYPQQPSSSMSYPGYQESSYRDQYSYQDPPPYRDPPPSYRDQPPPPPLPPTGQQSYHPAEQYYRQDYPSASSSSYRAEYSSRRQSYAEEEEEYVSVSEEDDNNTSSRREPSPEYEGDIRGRGTDTRR